LRAALPGVSIQSVIPDVDHRTYPLVVVSRAGGTRHEAQPRKLAFPGVDLAVFHDLGLVEAEELYEDVVDALYDAVRKQSVVEGVGYLHSIRETEGASVDPSPFPDTWYVHGSVQLGLRPAG
jgi:hypothetical protein